MRNYTATDKATQAKPVQEKREQPNAIDRHLVKETCQLTTNDFNDDSMLNAK